MTGFRETSFEDLVLQPSVEADGLTGAAQVCVQVRLSPGRDGFGPQLALAYDSGAGNSPCSLGWSLAGLPAIGIDTRRRLPTYDDEDGYVHAGGTELVPVLRRQGTGWVPVADVGPDWVIQRPPGAGRPLRHCLDLDGVPRQLPLFAPRIDPGMLVSARRPGSLWKTCWPGRVARCPRTGSSTCWTWRAPTRPRPRRSVAGC